MRRTRTAVRGLAIGAGAAVILFGGAGAAFADHLPPGTTFQPVTFCHAAPPDDPKKYIVITTDDAGVIAGHDEQHDGDIIPSFQYVDHNGDHQTFPGKNLDNGGQEILDNGCVIPTTTTPPTTTSTSTTTTTTTGTTTSSSPGRSTTPARPIPSGGVDTGNSGLVDDGSFNAPAALALLGVLGLAGGTAVAVRRRRSFDL